MSHTPEARTVIETPRRLRVPLHHVMEVIGRTSGMIDTELGKDFFALDEKSRKWKHSCASAGSNPEVSRTDWSWETDVAPLLDKTIEAIDEINRTSDLRGTEASTKSGRRNWFYT